MRNWFSLPLNGTTRKSRFRCTASSAHSNMKKHASLIRKIQLAAGTVLLLVILLVTGKELSTLAVDFWNVLCDVVWETGAVIEQLPI